MYKSDLDGVPFQLHEPYDLSFIRKYGKVFKVFDEQCMNVCFGVQNNGRRLFVKFAGAKPINFPHCADLIRDTSTAVNILRNATQTYQDLRHPSLINFLYSEEIGGGYAAVFDWTDAATIEPLNSPDYRRFMEMPPDKKLRAFTEILSFHAHAAAKGYVALDFYDGSILYDYDVEKVVICDIDLYQKSPYVGDLGLWGSTRYVSPEECATGAVMDEITTVYTMGATAFSLFAEGDRALGSWQLSKSSYDAALKAVSDDRHARQQSLYQFINEWRLSI
jgi:serine/threonine-protein kinase